MCLWMRTTRRLNFAYWHIVPAMSSWSTLQRGERYSQNYRLSGVPYAVWGSNWSSEKKCQGGQFWNCIWNQFVWIESGFEHHKKKRQLSISKLFWDISEHQGIFGRCGRTCKRKRICDNGVWQTKTGTGVIFQQFYAALVRGTCR